MKPQAATSGIAAAIAAAGTQIGLGRELGVSQQAVGQWIDQGWVPLLRAGQIERLYGIPRSRLVNPKILALVGSPTKEAP